ncbi:MAG: DNA-3-methyladenine glycosylase [Myxococcaceae bacterium]|nr:DNA-3-methyladenine glycosylase [Myxococcaceae bacterium]
MLQQCSTRSYLRSMPKILPQSFYARESLEVAVELIGKLLRHGPVTLRITEVEAYRFPGDTANHCRFGKTVRNAPMWGPPGHAYVYLCYGLHQMLNLVTDAEGAGAAVLIRACEPVEGLALVQARRGGKEGPVLLTGPGKIGSALGLDTSFNNAPLFSARRGRPGNALQLLDAPPVRELLVGPRVGVDYADPVHRTAPWRVAMAGTRWVSQRATLKPLDKSVAQFLAAERFFAADPRSLEGSARSGA